MPSVMFFEMLFQMNFAYFQFILLTLVNLALYSSTSWPSYGSWTIRRSAIRRHGVSLFTIYKAPPQSARKLRVHGS